MAKELTNTFGKGFSRANLYNMRQLYLSYQKCQTLSDKLSWSHYCELLSIFDLDKRSFYEKEAINANWSVRELKRQVDSSLFERLLLSRGGANKEQVLALALNGNESINHITDAAIDRCVEIFKKATFVMDRGYDDNKIFLKLLEMKQDFVIRLTQERKLFFHGKWVSATKLCADRKGKVKMDLFYKGEHHKAYLSHVKVQLTAAKKNIFLVLVYGITEYPMMLVTNKAICGKEDVMNVAKLYFSRWKIEEYFRSKKQIFDFENFRVRSLKSMNALNFRITLAMAFLSHMTRKAAANELLKSVLNAARAIKPKVQFYYYRIADGIVELLRCAKAGIRAWFKPERTDQAQLRFRLPA